MHGIAFIKHLYSSAFIQGKSYNLTIAVHGEPAGAWYQGDVSTHLVLQHQQLLTHGRLVA